MKSSPKTLVSIVVPCFNEAEVIGQTFVELVSVLTTLPSYDFEILFINDGSSDNTLEVLKELRNSHMKTSGNYLIRIVNFEFNQGHMRAIRSGYIGSEGDLIFTLDADLQDPPILIPEMLSKIEIESLDVVQAVRKNREVDSFFKRITAKIYYFVLRFWSGITIVPDAADFRVVTRKTKNQILSSTSNNSVFRLLIPSLNLKTGYVFFKRGIRAAGNTKYDLKSMLNLTFDSLLNFSSRPLKIISYLGFLFSIIYILGFILTIVLWLAFQTVPGWASLVALILLGNSVLIAILGLVGTYVSKIFDSLNSKEFQSQEI